MTDARPDGATRVELDATAQRVAGQWTVAVPALRVATSARRLSDAERMMRELIAGKLGVQPVDVVLSFQLLPQDGSDPDL